MFKSLILGSLVLALSSASGLAEEDTASLAKQRCPKPGRFALVFSFGYGGDSMPKEATRFDELLGKIKAAGFNTIHCTFTDERLTLCKKHDIQMMVDLLAEEHHVYKSPEKARAVCEKLRNNPDIWGYNIWNDVYRNTTPGRIRDLNTVRGWDPTHPAFTGTYRTDGMRTLNNPDIFGYYDFHWKRGVAQHFPHLQAYNGWAKERDAWFYSWLSVTSGLPGRGNFNRSLWSANTAIACGQKGILWFLGTSMMNQKTLEWTETGKDIARVQQAIAPLGKEVLKLGNPTAIYSTPVTRTANNDALPDGRQEMMPPGLERNAIPEDFWVRRGSGEFVMGIFKDDRQRDTVFLANLNAYASQDVTLRISGHSTASMFDGQSGKWTSLEIKDGTVSIALPPAGGELLRFEK